MRRSLRDLRAELGKVEARIDALYWTFTRCARGKPPAVVEPDIYQRRNALQAEIRARTRR